jgi:hypothetical protein
MFIIEAGHGKTAADLLGIRNRRMNISTDFPDPMDRCALAYTYKD